MQFFTEISTVKAGIEQAKKRPIQSLFEEHENRAENFSLAAAGLFLDYSKQNINEDELNSLIAWAKENNLVDKIKGMFAGDKINHTEQRAVLHTILRAPREVKQQVLTEQLSEQVITTEQHMVNIVDEVYQGKRLSSTGAKFTNVLAIGIGGSYYGIKVGLSALHPYHSTGLHVHVLANVDGAGVTEKLAKLNAATTLVVVISKTFTTQETLLNAKAIKDWMLAELSSSTALEKQWIAVSSNVEKAQEFGLSPDNILPMWDWVGGRFSLWSAVGLPLALAIGNDNFTRLKQGAYTMDQHFKEADFERNMPILMALIGMWNRNGLDYQALAVLPYDHALRALPGYLQQTDMESNGKSVSNQGKKLPWLTAPIVFGQEGTNGQHAFMQLMHQSDEIIPTDFIVALQGTSDFEENHKVLVANCFAQSEALMQGKSLQQVEAELKEQGESDEEIRRVACHKTMKGNTPSNTLLMQSLSPEALGAILALYEHKIFVQGALWQINSYDQWGVELGKHLSEQVLALMADSSLSHQMSPSSVNLIRAFVQKK
ncbi:MAG: glucose-6-phosphate isomerase [Colwellia sp.]|nr:glucose-6-phosphate isomerase [Colwellia sp.]MCW8866032.1 glucose-6-phosphate isomerase [Colwellia sp.]MCW9081637.1 glucose-6-phosphate isomerase [Colwellia sp.]